MSFAGVRAVLFDLDGTLIDSAADLHASVNKVLTRHGLPTLSLPQVISMIGHGVKKLVERAFIASGRPLDETALDSAHDEMIAIYNGHLTDLTTLMPGAAACVEELQRHGFTLGVVTNKPRAATMAILDHFGLASAMSVVIGGDSGLPRKPEPDMLLAALNALGLATTDAVMVGDSPADIDSARAAGIRSIAVAGGYSQVPVEKLGADRVISSLGELPALI